MKILNYFKSLFTLNSPKPRDVVYGFQALEARQECMKIRKKHRDLMNQFRETSDSEERKKIKIDIENCIKELDVIEKKYFGLVADQEVQKFKS